MQEKVTKNTFLYPKGYEPHCIIPSAARETLSDRTINRIINVSKELCMDG